MGFVFLVNQVIKALNSRAGQINFTGIEKTWEWNKLSKFRRVTVFGLFRRDRDIQLKSSSDAFQTLQNGRWTFQIL